MQTNNIDIPGAASYFQWFIGPEAPEGVWRDNAFISGIRFVVTGSVIPEPATWMLAAVTTAFLAVCMKRSQSMPRTVVATLALLVLGATSPVQAEILDGQTVTTIYRESQPHGLPSPQIAANSVVGPGTELTNFGIYPSTLLDVDFSDTNILITNQSDQARPRVADISFTDVYGTIPRFTGVTVNPATTWLGFTPSTPIHFEPNRISVFFIGPHDATYRKGDQIVLDLTAMIPEPASWLLAASAASLITLWRRPHASATQLGDHIQHGPLSGTH
jgi:hypothetical protein